MKKNITRWLYELEHDLHPHRIIGIMQETTGLDGLIARVDINASAFKPCFSGRIGSSRTLAITALKQIVITSDTVYGFLTRMAPTWNRSAQAQRIRQAYRSVLERLESLLEDCGKLDVELLSHIPLTAYSIPCTKMALRPRLISLK